LPWLTQNQCSNLSDRAYWGPSKVLRAFTPLLKPLSTNPHATLLLYFIASTREMQLHALHKPEKTRLHRAAYQATTRYLPTLNSRITPNWHPDGFRFQQAAGSVYWDWDAMWRRFEVEAGFRGLLAASGLKAREEHGLTDKWPRRMKTGSQEEFRVLLATAGTCFERYVECVRKA
jgi:hypothetical protein